LHIEFIPPIISECIFPGPLKFMVVLVFCSFGDPFTYGGKKTLGKTSLERLRQKKNIMKNPEEIGYEGGKIFRHKKGETSNFGYYTTRNLVMLYRIIGNVKSRMQNVGGEPFGKSLFEIPSRR
jgi:hypothetical protein